MLLSDAVAWQILTRHPGAGVDLPAYVKPDYFIWSRPQMETFLAFCEGHPDGVFWRLMLTTGLRIGEMVTLTWDDLFGAKLSVRETESRDEQGALLIGDPKSAYGKRALTLSKPMLAILQTHRQTQRLYREQVGDWWNAGNWMFPNRNGDMLRAAVMRVKFPRTCRSAGVPVVRPQDLRHANATDLMRSGVPAPVVQQRLGHYDVAFTLRRYSHPDDDMDSNAAEALERQSNSLFVAPKLHSGDKSAGNL
jgi:integrase